MKQIAESGTGACISQDRFASRDKARNDSLSRGGAMALARQLEKYWHDKGFMGARFWSEPIADRFDKLGTHELYRVACNLVNGLPPRIVP